ncbi:hypothetical protein [Pseudomonas sp. Leaf58]|nr:hypothetical protein [Pseudomonas sp. Leaf58]
MKSLALPSDWKLFAALAGLPLMMTTAVLAYQPNPDGLRSALSCSNRPWE